jgi:hypothetical protein
VIWLQNSGENYELYFKARIEGKWSSEIVINQGPGYLKLPDMKVDEKGKVHITFIKSINPNEPRGKYGCFYMNLEPSANNGVNWDGRSILPYINKKRKYKQASP